MLQFLLYQFLFQYLLLQFMLQFLLFQFLFQYLLLQFMLQFLLFQFQFLLFQFLFQFLLQFLLQLLFLLQCLFLSLLQCLFQFLLRFQFLLQFRFQFLLFQFLFQFVPVLVPVPVPVLTIPLYEMEADEVEMAQIAEKSSILLRHQLMLVSTTSQATTALLSTQYLLVSRFSYKASLAEIIRGVTTVGKLLRQEIDWEDFQTRYNSRELYFNRSLKKLAVLIRIKNICGFGTLGTREGLVRPLFFFTQKVSSAFETEGRLTVQALPL